MASLSPQQHRSRFGDTTLTKVFVGGLAWETPTEEMRRYFEQFGEILEAVIITDKNTGRSKGYGFVTFRDPESARRSVSDPNPIIDGRRANCNIASMGRPRPSPPRGRNQAGISQQGPPQAVGPQYTRVPTQMAHPHQIYYPTPYGYVTYPSEYAYQQGLYNSQVASQFYHQMYGTTSSSSPGTPHPYPYPYNMGYSPRPGFPLPYQAHRPPPYVQYPTAQIEGSFTPSLPYGFQLQAPPNVRQDPNTTDPQALQQSSTGANNESPDG
ncbi:uncharacterized protein A4U43_C03F2650 [Asparagus officinalis]|uniref:RRM domain-containing protein n=1 Tax=Asparagus officinalis TaxID=4686 RepID=A0A5P1F6V3_ASPOF|nr:probable RNA-binding protein ARP1 [Asparagus officinalis]ONK74088.1 uncharacterized protein A4U43_C03F2650 [Asparagus officinalis]